MARAAVVEVWIKVVDVQGKDRVKSHTRIKLNIDIDTYVEAKREIADKLDIPAMASQAGKTSFDFRMFRFYKRQTNFEIINDHTWQLERELFAEKESDLNGKY